MTDREFKAMVVAGLRSAQARGDIALSLNAMDVAGDVAVRVAKQMGLIPSEG